MKTAMALSADDRSRLIGAARTVIEKAYAPYSKFRVGAALLTENGQIIAACNVENASISLSICAERAAIFSAIAKVGSENIKIKAIAVLNERNIPCSPCGACRQVIAEFASNAIILFQGMHEIEEITILELLPKPFLSYE